MKFSINTIYLAGGCLWGVQEFFRHIPGVLVTEAGRANGSTQMLNGDYDGYAECIKLDFDGNSLSVTQLIEYLFEIIDPYSVDKQGPDIGKKYRAGVYSTNESHLSEAKKYIASIQSKDVSKPIAIEVLPLINYLKSADEHQDRLQRFPDEVCHLPKPLLYKYRRA